MSYLIDGYDINDARYGNAENTNVYLQTNNFGEVFKSNNWAFWNDLINSGLFIKPPRPDYYYIWDDVNDEWVVNQWQFLPILKSNLIAYRNSATAQVVTYNNISIENIPSVRAELVEKIAYLETKNAGAEIYYNSGEGSVLADKADFEGLLEIAGDMEVNGDISVNHVLEQHAITPYQSLAAAFSAFDDHFSALQGE